MAKKKYSPVEKLKYHEERGQKGLVFPGMGVRL